MIMLNQIIPVAKLIYKKPEGYENVITVLLPVLKSLLTDPNSEVNTQAATVLADIAELLSNKDRGEYVLTIALGTFHINIKELAHSGKDTSSRVAAIKLLSKLALKLERDLCEHFLTFEIISMADSPDQMIRKATVMNFINVCQMVSKEFFTNKLLPIYQKLY